MILVLMIYYYSHSFFQWPGLIYVSIENYVSKYLGLYTGQLDKSLKFHTNPRTYNFFFSEKYSKSPNLSSKPKRLIHVEFVEFRGTITFHSLLISVRNDSPTSHERSSATNLQMLKIIFSDRNISKALRILRRFRVVSSPNVQNFCLQFTLKFSWNLFYFT